MLNRGLPLVCNQITWRQPQALALQGLVLFSLNYWFFYSSEQYLVSGIPALIAATLSLMNITNGRIFLGQRSSLRTIIGALLGLGGLVLALWGELSGFLHNHGAEEHMLLGFALALGGTYCASIGNIISAYLEGFEWTTFKIIGIALVLCGNILIINLPKQKPQHRSADGPSALRGVINLSCQV